MEAKTLQTRGSSLPRTPTSAGVPAGQPPAAAPGQPERRAAEASTPVAPPRVTRVPVVRMVVHRCPRPCAGTANARGADPAGVAAPPTGSAVSGAVRLPEGSGESATPRPSETSHPSDPAPYLHLTDAGLNERLAARRRVIRLLLRAALARAHALGEFHDACCVVDLSDRNYTDALVEDLLRQLAQE